MSLATLTINSRNYGAWSLRGWLLCKFAGLDFTVEVIDSQDPDARAELLLLSPSFLVPRLSHDTLPCGTPWPWASTCTSSCPMARSCPPTRWPGPGAARCRERSTPASPTCARRCR